MQPKYGAFSSSVNPQELATSVQGVVKIIAGGLVAFGLMTTFDASTFTEQIPVIVSSGYAALGGIEVIFGILRKIVVRFTEQ